VGNITFQVESLGISDVGLIRESNEDVWAVFPERGLFLLADGMGGRAAGEIAAQEAVAVCSKLVEGWHVPDEKVKIDEGVDFFRKALQRVNTQVYEKGCSEKALNGMGTTLVTLYFLNDYGILAHVGDSRIYRLRTHHLEQLTEDHSLVTELLSLGEMKPENALTFPYQHILTRAIGTAAKVEPSLNAVQVESYDLFMLCSDGLTNYVTDKEISQILSSDLSLKERGQKLVDLANEHGGGDNVTLVLVDVGDDLSR